VRGRARVCVCEREREREREKAMCEVCRRKENASEIERNIKQTRCIIGAVRSIKLDGEKFELFEGQSTSNFSQFNTFVAKIIGM